MNWLRILVNGSLWSIAGVLVTLAIFYFQEKRNTFELAIQIEDEVNLVEVREAVPDLHITYKSEDLLESRRELKLIRLKIQNTGETILQSHFDQSVPFNLLFPGWRVLEATIGETNSEYLKSHLLKAKNPENPTQAGAENNFITLNPIIFERNKFASLKIYLLQESNQPLKITVAGKIANIDSFQVTREEQKTEFPSVGRKFIEPFFVGF